VELSEQGLNFLGWMPTTDRGRCSEYLNEIGDLATAWLTHSTEVYFYLEAERYDSLITHSTEASILEEKTSRIQKTTNSILRFETNCR